MRQGDKQIGQPNVLFSAAQSAIEALTSAPVGSLAFATDLDSALIKKAAEWAAVGGGADFSGVSVFNTGGQNVNNLTTTWLTWDVEDFDTDDYHDNSTNPDRLTVPTDGIYFIIHQARITQSAGTYHGFALYLNGDEIMTDHHAINTSTVVSGGISLIRSLSAGNYLRMNMRHNSGSTETVEGMTRFQVFRLVEL